MYQGKVTIEEILEAAVRCGAYDDPVRPKQMQDLILEHRLGILTPNYSSERSLRMRVENRIERFSTNRKRGSQPFYFEGLEPGW